MQKKNQAAAELGRLRWKGKTKAQKKAHATMMAMKRWAKKPPEEPPKQAEITS